MFSFKKIGKESLEQSEFGAEIKSSILCRCLNFIVKISVHIIYFSLFFGLALYVKHETNLIEKNSQISIAREADILTALSDVDSKIEKLSRDHQQILILKTELGHIEETMVTEESLSGLAKADELKKIAMQLQKFTTSSIFARSHHSSSKIPTHRRSRNIRLPFRVLSIDSMAGQAFASVQYHQDTLPLRLNDQLAGWKAVRLDGLAGIAVWENAQRRRITTTVAEMHHV